MRIVLQLNPAASSHLRKPRARKHAEGALAWLTLDVRPMHSSTTDRSLQSFFTVDVEDRDEAARLVERLRTDPDVEAAYIKPDDALP